MTWYLTIRSDSTYSNSVATPQLLDLVATLPELSHAGPASFTSAPGQPWLSLIVAKADSACCYVVGETLPSTANILEMVCSDTEEPTWYEALAIRIGASLGWEVLEEHEGRRILPLKPGKDEAEDVSG
jgi:hypothetical protein